MERTEDDLISLLPHLRDNRLARVNNTSEPDLDVFEFAKRLQDVLARNTHSAQPVKDGPRESESRRGSKAIKSALDAWVCHAIRGARRWS